MIVDIDPDIIKDIIAVITERRNSLIIDNLWKQVPSLGFTGSTAVTIDTTPPSSQAELDIKLKKFDNLINQLKAQTDFT